MNHHHIEAMRQALEALEYEASRGNDDAYRIQREALRTAIAEADRKKPVAWATDLHFDADTDAIGMAIHDALVCGTGVVKLWLDAGKMNFDHVSIKDFAVFGDELKWRAAHTGKEKMND